MRTLLTVLALVFAVAIAHAQPAPVAPQTTVLYGYVYRTNLSAAAGAIIITERTIPLASQPFVIGQAQRRDTANAAGFISMRVLRNSIVYISAADRAGYLGIPASPGAVRINIPDADSVMLVTDTSTIAIPQTHVIARPLLTLSDGITSGAISALTITGSSVGSVTFNGASASIVLNGGGAATNYGDSIHVADSLARSRRTFISRISTAITLDSSTDGAGRIYYMVSLDPDSVQAWLRDSSMTWMLGRVVQLADSGSFERGYMTPTQIRTLLAGYSVTGHAHAIADVTGLATALGDTVSYHDRMSSVEGSLAVILDTIAAVKGRLATVVSDLNAHIGAADAHLPTQTGQAGKVLGTNGTVTSWQPEADPIFTAAAPTLRSKGDTLVDVRQTHLEMPNLTHILTADSNKTICVDNTGRLYLCWKGSGGAAVIDTNLFVGVNRNDLNIQGRKVYNSKVTFSDTVKVGNEAGPVGIYRMSGQNVLAVKGLALWANNVTLEGGGKFTIDSYNTQYAATYISMYSGLGGALTWVNGGAWYNGKPFGVHPGHASNRPPEHGMSAFVVEGSARISDTLIVKGSGGVQIPNGGVSAPNGMMSGKSVVGDSVVARISVLDTTGFVISDSLKWRVIEEERPVFVRPVSNNSMIQTGSKTLDVYMYIQPAGDMRAWFCLESDTANGIYISDVEYVVHGYHRAWNPNGPWPVNGVARGWIGGGYSPGWYKAASGVTGNAGLDFNLQSQFGAPSGSTVSVGRIAVYTSGNNYGPFRAQIKVTWTKYSAARSDSWYIRIQNDY